MFGMIPLVEFEWGELSVSGLPWARRISGSELAVYAARPCRRRIVHAENRNRRRLCGMDMRGILVQEGIKVRLSQQ